LYLPTTSDGFQSVGLFLWLPLAVDLNPPHAVDHQLTRADPIKAGGFVGVPPWTYSLIATAAIGSKAIPTTTTHLVVGWRLPPILLQLAVDKATMQTPALMLLP
jgi:hypothetical protein